MSAKMNWDRVRKENRILKQGSAWLESETTMPPPSKSALKFKRTSSVLAGPRMPGCTCRKPVGFTAEHKKSCPMALRASSTGGNSIVRGTPIPTSRRTGDPAGLIVDANVRLLSDALRRAGVNGPWKEFVQVQIRMLANDRTLDPIDLELVTAILEDFSSPL
jgi:hypothetical protein